MSSDDKAPEVVVLPLIPKVQREEVKHSFEGEKEEEKSSSATAMLSKLLKNGVKPDQENEQASILSPDSKKKRIKRKAKTLVTPPKGVVEPAWAWSLTPFPHRFLPSSSGTPSCQLGRLAVMLPTMTHPRILRPTSPLRRS